MALIAAMSIALGFFLVRPALQQQLATQSAKTSFGRLKLNVLVLGYQDEEAVTDTMILLHLDVARRLATLVSVPRDTWVKIPGHGYDKINSAYAYGGSELSARAVSALMGGIPIDATVALQPEDAAAIVDAMGGLSINVDEDMDYDDNSQSLHIHLRKGEQHLSGTQVAGYIRFRHDPASDFGRMKRQQQVVKLMMDQLSEPQNWPKLPKVLGLAHKRAKTTLRDGQLLSLLTIYRNVPDDNVRSFTLPSKAGWVGDASVVFVDQRWAKLIGSLLFGRGEPPQDEVLVANASGNAALDKTLIGALRGAGWNVPTFVDERVKRKSLVVGATPAAAALAKTFSTAIRSGTKTALVVGADMAPDAE
ncbi:MAG: LCP family protein [Candidatus Eremiobacteraeota bacterium]|nr:LCP family protein [Candidatus Eremiobacteraeota bacterium]